jgi:small subunit ribosomal protein S6e
MPFKCIIAEKSGKTWKLELSSEVFVGKVLGDVVKGEDLSDTLKGYELEIRGASDNAGFPHKKDVEGPELKRVLFKRGWGMHNNQEGLRIRKSVRGKQLSEKTAQINLQVVKAGPKKLEELFPDQNKPKEKAAAPPAA